MQRHGRIERRPRAVPARMPARYRVAAKRRANVSARPIADAIDRYFWSLTSVYSASTTFSSLLAAAAAAAAAARRRRHRRRPRPPPACACAYIISPSFCAAADERARLGVERLLARRPSASAGPRRPCTAASILRLFVGADLVAVLGQRLLHAVHQRVERVARLHDLELLACRPRRAPRRPSPSSGSRPRTGPSSP